ncbi:sensor histidine kinase [Sphingorhabdus contaminans]|uniref:sensor histidine kinase n=1 Tax=Sphingorhabdus contaminans TaxID=1343899 RepID=UPI003D2ABA21
MYSIAETVKPIRSNAFLRYGVAVAAFATALLLRFVLQEVLPPGFPYLTFFPAVILTAFIAGTRPGILCAALSGIAAWYYFIPPFGAFGMDIPTAFALGFYTFIVGVDITLFHFMFKAADQLRSEREVTAQLYERQRTMFQELQHRVANNMSVVAALLSMQKRKVTADPATASSALDEAASRIGVMSSIHRRLYDPASAELPIRQFFYDLGTDLLRAAKNQANVRFSVDTAAVKLDMDRLMTLSLLVSELMTNSLKHGFAGRPGGNIWLSLHPVEGDKLELIIRDDGHGLPADFDPLNSNGLGTLITQALSQQLNGTLHIEGQGGTTARLLFPR